MATPDPCIEAVFYLSGTEGRVARGRCSRLCIVALYIVALCGRCSYPSQGLARWRATARVVAFKLHALSPSVFRVRAPPAHRPPPPLMKIYRWRASFLVLLDHSLHCDRPPPPFVPRFFSSSGATRRGKGTGEIGVCFFLGDVLSRMANPEENGGKKVLKCRGLKTRLPTYILIFLYLKFNSYI